MTAISRAASVLLTPTAGSPAVYLVTRSPTLRFMGGMVAFPGGKVHASDDALARPTDGLTVDHVAAVRELFEETGVLLARDAAGRFPPSAPHLDQLRRLLLADAIPFADLLHQHGWRLDPTDLTPAGRLVTPAFVPTRFDTAFFVAHCPPEQRPEVWEGELTAGVWHTAAAAVTHWQRGELPLSPPTLAILRAVEGRPVDEAPERLRPELDRLDRGELPAIWAAPGVLLIPLASGGLPPTTHTNAYLVGTGPTYLLDPGPADADEQARLFGLLDDHPFDAVVLSHHHPDHIGAAVACARRYRVPILAHAATRDRLAGRIPIDRTLTDGDRLPLGTAPHGRGEWALQAVWTPGHAPGHLAFFEPDYGLLFAGDMVSPLSSMIVSPQDGDLAEYVASLRQLNALPARMLLPSHGGPTLRPHALLEETIRHREVRERQLLAALEAGPRTLAELTLELYRGFPEPVRNLGRVQIEAGLLKLQREGRVRSDGDAYHLLEP